MKTYAFSLSGTPPRLDGRTINYQGLEEQRGDDPPSPFSFLHHTVPYAVSKKQGVKYRECCTQYVPL